MLVVYLPNFAEPAQLLFKSLYGFVIDFHRGINTKWKLEFLSRKDQLQNTNTQKENFQHSFFLECRTRDSGEESHINIRFTDKRVIKEDAANSGQERKSITGIYGIGKEISLWTWSWKFGKKRKISGWLVNG